MVEYFGKRMTNYIPDNPSMAQPPTHWLQRLWDFDSDLVVLPSRQRPFAYVLARRARRSRGLIPETIYDHRSDTGMCFKYRLVPVTLIIRHTDGWSIDNILRDLASRDTWRHRKARFIDENGTLVKGAAAAVEQQESEQEQKRQQQLRDNFWHRSGDAWRSYQARTGQRTKSTIALPLVVPCL